MEQRLATRSITLAHQKCLPAYKLEILDVKINVIFQELAGIAKRQGKQIAQTHQYPKLVALTQVPISGLLQHGQNFNFHLGQNVDMTQLILMTLIRFVFLYILKQIILIQQETNTIALILQY